MKNRNPSIRKAVATCLALAYLLSIPASIAQSPAVQSSSAPQDVAVVKYDNSFEIFKPVWGLKGMVATEQHLATQAGAEILRQGGNAVDAAVAVGFALAVVLPNAGNLGGGGFMLIHDSAKSESIALDFREVAPASATRDMYLDDKGNVIAGKSTRTPYSVGVPGTVAGLTQALSEHGTMPLAKVMAPAIKLATEGFRVSPVLAEQFNNQRTHLERWPATKAIFFKHKSPASTCRLEECPAAEIEPYKSGDLLIQKDLAHSLNLIAQHGAKGFYEGEIAKNIVRSLTDSVSTMTLADLSNYKTVKRKPVEGTYRGIKILSMPAPSSGGIHLIQMLNLLERYPLQDYGFGSAKSIHLMAESARLAYADRAEHLGDPEFFKVPGKGLVSKKYADSISPLINIEKSTPSKNIKAGQPQNYESDQTTHFSVMDDRGNVVSTTYTLNLNFGSGIVAGGTGILLNNEMDDFSIKPGVANAFGLVGGDANAVAPGKRPLSSMTPVILMRDGQPWIATGSPGGARIITTVLQNIVNVIDFKMNIAEAASMPRMHHQWLPDFLRVERGISPDTIEKLKAMGHDVKVMPTMGRVQTVQYENKQFYGASDPRNPDGSAIGIEQKK